MTNSSSKKSQSTDAKKPWYSEGLQFACQGSGQCCTSHGEYGFVYLSLTDRKKMALHLGLSETEFRRKHCREIDGFWALKDAGQIPGFGTEKAIILNQHKNDCQFLDGKRCGIYQSRPTQCRTWPFWPEVMTPKKWKKDVEAFCPGVNKGPIRTQREIDDALAEQNAHEHEMQLEAHARQLQKKKL